MTQCNFRSLSSQPRPLTAIAAGLQAISSSWSTALSMAGTPPSPSSGSTPTSPPPAWQGRRSGRRRPSMSRMPTATELPACWHRRNAPPRRRGRTIDHRTSPRSFSTFRFHDGTTILQAHYGEPFGTQYAFDLNGQHYFGRLEQHCHPPGGPEKPWGYHTGVSLFVQMGV